MVWLNVAPRFDPIRAEPRFRALIQRMRLDPDASLADVNCEEAARQRAESPSDSL